jgi:hypothetical protein
LKRKITPAKKIEDQILKQITQNKLESKGEIEKINLYKRDK